MAKESWYQTNQMKLFALRVPPGMLEQIRREAEVQGLSKKDLYRSIIVAFLRRADQAVYLASYKSADASTLRFWMDKDIYDCIVEIAKLNSISLTSACYTAFYNHYAKPN